MDTVVLTRKFNTAARTLFVYEYLLTLDLEVEYFWRSRMTRATALYFANRYTNVALAITNVIELVTKTESDQVLEITLVAEIVLAQLLLLAFSVLRVHAVTDRNRFYTLAVFLTALVSPVILTYIDIRSYGYATPPPLHACAVHSTLSLVDYDRLIIVARLGVVLCDLCHHLRPSSGWCPVGAPQASVAYGAGDGVTPKKQVLFMLNFAQIIVSALHLRNPMTIGAFLSPITSIFITRMLTSLRQADRSLDDDFLSLFVRADIQNVETFTLHELSTLHFTPLSRSSVEDVGA
ncbi:hypothetical protein C8T65DRAFT_698401 [Cerioporus squamosus]|nr:hypothetical protein C8T65DRAFT_698401 [Cerioporus squamosus]